MPLARQPTPIRMPHKPAGDTLSTPSPRRGEGWGEGPGGAVRGGSLQAPKLFLAL